MSSTEDYVSRLGTKLGFPVMISDRISSRLPDTLHGKLLKGTAKGWMDDRTGGICLYRNNLSDNQSGIDSDVAFLYVMQNGLRSFLGDNIYNLLCIQSCGLDSSARESFNKGDLIALGAKHLDSLSDVHTPDWDRIASFVSSATGLHDSWKLAEALCKGHAQHQKIAHHRAVKSDNYNLLDHTLVKSLGSIPNGTGLSLGQSSEVFERLGYPKCEVTVKRQTIETFLTNNGIDKALLSDIQLVNALHNPLLVLKGKEKNDGKKPMNIFVSESQVPGKGYIAFGVRNDEEVLKGFDKGVMNRIQVDVITMYSDFRLLMDLSSTEDALKYCKPKFGESGTTYKIMDVLLHMEGKSEMELGRKSVSGNVPSSLSIPLSRRLNVATNLVNNFKNPISSEQRLKFFGSTLFEDNLSKLKQRREELRTVNKPMIMAQKERTFSERLNSYIDESYFSQTAYRRFVKAQVFKARDLISLGEEGFVKAFGKRALPDAIRFLEANGLTFNSISRIPFISLSKFDLMSSEEKIKAATDDLVLSLQNIPNDVTSRHLKMPRTSAGSFFIGANSVNLMARMASVPQWRNCNIFVTQKETENLGYTIKSNAVPCYLLNKEGETRVIYNLSDTSFASDHPALFDSISEQSRRTSPEVSLYLKNILSGLSGVRKTEAEGVRDFIDDCSRKSMDLGKLGTAPLSLSKMSAVAARELGIKNPLETRGRKSKSLKL